jgi:hypothetical protein
METTIKPSFNNALRTPELSQPSRVLIPPAKTTQDRCSLARTIWLLREFSAEPGQRMRQMDSARSTLRPIAGGAVD